MSERFKKMVKGLAAAAVLFGVVAACTGDAPPVFLAGPILEGAGPEGQLALDGAVVNGKEGSARYVQVSFILYDSDGAPIETITELVEGTGDLGTLESGEEGTFFVLSDTPADRIARIEYVLAYDDSSSPAEPLR